MTDPVRVRIAPSPTGDPHVGTAYVALFNQVFARQHGGRFILRIEDTDQARSSRDHEDAIYKALRWVGLQWDEGPDVGGEFGPYRQSERTEIYRGEAEKLIESGAAYRCFCTPEELAIRRKEMEAAGRDPRYDGRCRDLSNEESLRRKESEPFVVRLRVPSSGETTFRDEIRRDDITLQNREIDDQVILKSDGFPTYHLANVVDDHRMEITHVIRGGDWITSTPKHVLLYDAFGWKKPAFAHLPLLLNPDKSKISKRKSPTSLLWYEEQGFLPQALLNFLGLLGFSMPDETEVFTPEALAEVFSLSRVQASNSVFDLTKLEWLNGVYLRDLTPQDLATRIRAAGIPHPEDPSLEEVLPLIQERIKKLSEVEEKISFFFRDRALEYEAPLLLPKKQKDPRTVARVLSDFANHLPTEEKTLSPERFEELCVAAAERAEWKKGDFFMALRIAVTGSKVTPPLCESMEVLGVETVRRRTEEAVAKLETLDSPVS